MSVHDIVVVINRSSPSDHDEHVFLIVVITVGEFLYSITVAAIYTCISLLKMFDNKGNFNINITKIHIAKTKPQSRWVCGTQNCSESATHKKGTR